MDQANNLSPTPEASPLVTDSFVQSFKSFLDCKEQTSQAVTPALKEKSRGDLIAALNTIIGQQKSCLEVTDQLVVDSNPQLNLYRQAIRATRARIVAEKGMLESIVDANAHPNNKPDIIKMDIVIKETRFYEFQQWTEAQQAKHAKPKITLTQVEHWVLLIPLFFLAVILVAKRVFKTPEQFETYISKQESRFRKKMTKKTKEPTKKE